MWIPLVWTVRCVMCMAPPGGSSRPRGVYTRPEEPIMTHENSRAFRIRPDMHRGLRTEVPLPTRLVSNEEFPPLPQTAAQRAVEDRILAAAGRLAPRLGQSRRDFLRRSGGMATSLLAMNAVFGRFVDVLEVEAGDPAAVWVRSGGGAVLVD